MRKNIKDSILDVIKSGYEIHDEIKRLIRKKDIKSVLQVLEDYQELIIQMADIIEKVEKENHPVINIIEKHCEVIYKVYNDIINRKEAGVEKQIKYELDKSLIKCENVIKEKIKVKLEIVFCPYKVSMWDSLESIWQVVQKDEECDAYVIPLPYYTRNSDMSLGDYHYENTGYPKEVKITDYRDYDFLKRKPDIIYIHNPFDDANTVTCVAPQFHSKKLKEYTQCLVYVPYHITGIYSDRQALRNTITSGFHNADVIVLPSHKQKDFLVSVGLPKAKFKVLGSPKFDYLIKNIENITIPEEWKEKAKNKKVFLLNSTISIVLNDKNWIENIMSILNKFKERKDVLLIWRPHPLLKDTISSMRPNILEAYQSIEKSTSAIDNIIIDKESTVYPAIKLSHALISTYSSIVMQYSITGKPLLLMGKSAARSNFTVCFDFFSSYFIGDGVSLEVFIDMIVQGKDEKKEERMIAIKNSTVNIDGTCGEKVHEELKKYILLKMKN